MASPLMRIPAELRLMIYAYLFDAGSDGTSKKEMEADKHGKQSRTNPRTISIRNSEVTAVFPFTECSRCNGHDKSHLKGDTACSTKSQSQTRARYHIVQRSFHRRCVETTYRMTNDGAYFCAALMRVNRALAAETAHVVYGGHVFDFGADLEAVKPFFSDLTPKTRALVKRVALYKRGPWLFDSWSDRCEWRGMCAYLREHVSIEHLRLTVQAGRLRENRDKARDSERQDDDWGWDADADEFGSGSGCGLGARVLSSEDVALLVDIRHDTLDWVGDLVRLKSLARVDVTPDFCTVPRPQTSNMFVYLAFSASVDKGFREFLERKLGLAG
ncbi:hypothetical protein GGR51DRAFT_336608 [Nemania sp. FL0031]|nr:hypothetical protein GGR51DRAFT_336608 [Nemania sp. FL0031]